MPPRVPGIRRDDVVLPKRVPVLFCDLDGTVRHGLEELGRFVNCEDDVVLFDGVPELLASYRDAGWRVAAVSNQGGIALGHVSDEDVAAAMRQTFKDSGQAFDRIEWCSHHPSVSRCWCRKPMPGMPLRAVFELARLALRRGDRVPQPEVYPPDLALFVGDRPEDEACAAALGVEFMWAHEWRATTAPPASRAVLAR